MSNRHSIFHCWQLHYKETGKLVGAEVNKYLLERSRVVSRAKGQTNFHVFSYLLQVSTFKSVFVLTINTIIPVKHIFMNFNCPTFKTRL